MISRELQRQVTRGTDQTSDRIRRAQTPPSFFATVASVTAGAARDGNALVAITYRGEQITVAGYAGSYSSPAQGHRVLCHTVDHQVVIVCRVVGYP